MRARRVLASMLSSGRVPVRAGACKVRRIASADRVNMRAGAGTDNPVVTGLTGGSAVQALGPTGGEWVQVQTADGQQVHEPAGVQSFETGVEGASDSLPVLYLPEGETVEFQLESRDVIHSFWVVDFLYKKDMIPGHTTTFQVTPERSGTYRGKCAELCGEYHSDMLFNVVVVPADEFQAHLDELESEGNTGELGVDLNRNQDDWSMREKYDEGVDRTQRTADTTTTQEGDK